MISPTLTKFVVMIGGFSDGVCFGALFAGSGAAWPAMESISIWRLETGGGALDLRMAGVEPWATASMAAARGSSWARMPEDSSWNLDNNSEKRMMSGLEGFGKIPLSPITH